VILGLVLLTANGPASANHYELLRRVPESANTIILIDVERMLMSPIAMKEAWRKKGNSEGVALHFPINAVRYMLALKRAFKPLAIWRMCSIEWPIACDARFKSRINRSHRLFADFSAEARLVIIRALLLTPSTAALVWRASKSLRISVFQRS